VAAGEELIEDGFQERTENLGAGVGERGQPDQLPHDLEPGHQRQDDRGAFRRTVAASAAVRIRW
jgi:hypothetical protein